MYMYYLYSVSRLLSNGTYYRTHKLTEKMRKYTSAPNESCCELFSLRIRDAVYHNTIFQEVSFICADQYIDHKVSYYSCRVLLAAYAPAYFDPILRVTIA